jgi:uncharacterized protein YjbI with pentapeptide repeats
MNAHSDEPTSDAAKRQWRARFVAKYNWDSLAETPLHGLEATADGRIDYGTKNGVRRATLQDFWRAEESRLVKTPDGLFTRWHLPPGVTESPKPANDEILRTLASVIQSFGMLPAKRNTPLPIPFDGVGFADFNGFVAAAELLADAGHSWRLRDSHMAGTVQLDNVAFRSLHVGGMTFLEDFTCDGGRIHKFDISGAIFFGDCSMSRLHVGSFAANGTRFEKNWWVGRCHFEQEFIFGNSSVADWCEFRSCTFQAAEFRKSTIRMARWRSCAADELTLSEVRVGGSLWTADNEIGRFVATDLQCEGDLTLSEGDGGKFLYLKNARVTGRTSFNRPPSVDDLDAEGAHFLGGADFGGMTAKSARFTRVVFKGQLSFRGATFRGAATFDNAEWPADARLYAGAFRDCRFLDASDFSTPNFNVIAAFNEAYFSRPPLVPIEEGKAGDRRFSLMLDQAREAAILPPDSDREANQVFGDRFEFYYGALEGGARVLKQAMETRRARTLEQRLYRYELIARRHRPSLGRWERALSWLYGASSNYGASSLRPLAILLAMTLLLGAVYAGWAALLGASVSGELVQDGLTFSGRSVFRPFEVWSVAPGTSQDGIGTSILDSPWGLALRLLSSLQSFLSLILTFLVGLSLKRRFQLG